MPQYFAWSQVRTTLATVWTPSEYLWSPCGIIIFDKWIGMESLCPAI
jgi:hypothetical protein